MTAYELTPGARHFLAQRDAEGITDVTDEQAETLARIFAPRKERAAAATPRDDGASPVVVVGRGPRGDFDKQAAS